MKLEQLILANLEWNDLNGFSLTLLRVNESALFGIAGGYNSYFMLDVLFLNFLWVKKD